MKNAVIFYLPRMIKFGNFEFIFGNRESKLARKLATKGQIFTIYIYLPCEDFGIFAPWVPQGTRPDVVGTGR